MKKDVKIEFETIHKKNVQKALDSLNQIGEYLLSIPPNIIVDKQVSKRFAWLVETVKEIEKMSMLCNHQKIKFMEFQE